MWIEEYLDFLYKNFELYQYYCYFTIGFIALFFIFKKILFMFSSSYRQSIFRDQVIAEMKRDERIEREREINDRIDDKESVYLSEK